MENNRLKPCPFCGGEACIYAPGPIEHHVACRNPECYAESHGWSTEAEAIEAWNTRADFEFGGIPCTEENMREYGWVRLRKCHETAIDKFFRGCSECGYMWEYMYRIGRRVGPNYCPNCGAEVER